MRRLVKGVGMAAISAALLMTGLSVGHAGFSYVACAEDSDFVIQGGSLLEYTGDDVAVVIPDGVTSIEEQAFNCCKTLESVKIPESVTRIEMAAFFNCTNLTKIESTNNVKYIDEYAFDYCSSLKYIYVDCSVEELNVAYYTDFSLPDDCSIVCSSVSDWDDYLAIDNNVLNGPDNKRICVQTVIIPDGVTKIASGAFDGYIGMTNVVIPDSVTSISFGAFSNCSSLESIYIPSGVNEILYGEIFSGCDNLVSITVDDDNETYDSRDNCNAIIETATNTLISGCNYTVIPATVKSIGTSAFCNCSKLKKVNIPDGVTSIENCAFWGCSSLTTIDIPNSVTSIGIGAFWECSSLTSIEIPSSVTDIGDSAFWECSSLKSIEIPSSVTDIGDGAFWRCSNLTEISVNSQNKIYDSRDNCNAIIETETNTLIAGCQNTVIPENITCIGSNAFGGCSNLTSIEIPDGVTDIENLAFDECCGLTSISIPSSVTSIGEDAFVDCSNLVDIYYGGTEEEWNNIISNNIGIEDNCTIHYHVHSIVTLSAKEATYTETGLTEGSYCSTCGKVIVAQTKIDKKNLDKVVISSISNTTSGITFSWNKVTDANGYRVYRKNGTGSYALYKTITSANTTSFTDTAVTGGTTYTYAVRAYVGSTYSTFTGKSIKYLAPASVSALVNYSKGIQVKWSKITGASGYYIYRKAGSETKWSKVATVTSGSTLKWNDTNTTAGLKYQYCIKAYSGSTMGAYKAGVTTYRVTTPSISSVTNSAAGKATVKWNKNTSATGYQISYTTGSTTKTITVSGNTNVSKVISGLTKGKTYTVKVRSYRKVGTTYYYSTWSSAKSVKITK